MNESAASGATGEHYLSPFDDDVAKVLSKESISPAAVSPEKSSLSLANRVKQRTRAADQAVREHQRKMESEAHTCEKKVANIARKLNEMRVRVGESARHMLDKQRGCNAHGILKDALPVLQNYAYILSNANASARLELLHLSRERESIKNIMSYVDYMQSVVQHVASSKFFPRSGRRAILLQRWRHSDSLQDQEDRVTSALSDLAFLLQT